MTHYDDHAGVTNLSSRVMARPLVNRGVVEKWSNARFWGLPVVRLPDDVEPVVLLDGLGTTVRLPGRTLGSSGPAGAAGTRVRLRRA